MLSKRFKCLGEGADLGQVIVVDEKAITLALHYTAHLNLFGMTDSPNDLREALLQHELLDSEKGNMPHPNRSDWLDSIACALGSRFKQSGLVYPRT